MVINNKNNLLKFLFIYRSFFFKFIKFETTLEDKESKIIIEALNIKGRKKRIYFIIDNLCNTIDDYHKGKNICGFKNSKCSCHRIKKLNYKNGCCRCCKYQTSKGCPSKNFACKMFNCSYVKNNYKVIEYKDLKLLKVLTPIQRYVLKSDYFSTIDEVTKDLYLGPFYSLFRLSYLLFKTLIYKYKNS